MDGWFSWEAFTSFGPNPLDPEPPVVRRVDGRRSAILRKQVREICPDRPGVYGMVDTHGELIYVGKAKSLRKRLLGYFRSRSRDPKAGRIVARSRAILWEHAPSEFAALLRELDLIRRWRPRYNVMGHPGRLPTYICLGRQPAPYLFLSRRPSARVLACFGPIFAGKRASTAVRRLNDLYGLRDCPQAQTMIFADQEELFPTERAPGCIRLELQTCLGPCAAACTRTAYTQRVRAARSFLEGRDLSPLEAMERDMAAAAAAMEFERAAIVRDRLESIRWLHERLDHVRRAREKQSFLYRVPGHDDRELWYVICSGRVVRVASRPTTATERRDLQASLGEIVSRPMPIGGGLPGGDLDTFLLVAAWFRRHPQERQRTVPLAEVTALCRKRS